MQVYSGIQISIMAGSFEIQQHAVLHNLQQYESAYQAFSWEEARTELAGLPMNNGLNIAFEAIDRHALGEEGNTVAIRWIRKDRSIKDFSYNSLQHLSSRFANVLVSLGIKKGDRVFSLAGRIPELYITALGTLKAAAVFCPLFSVFGPEPVFQRLSRGDAKVLVTTRSLYEKKVRHLLVRLPMLQFVLLTDAEAHIDSKVLSFPRLLGV